MIFGIMEILGQEYLQMDLLVLNITKVYVVLNVLTTILIYYHRDLYGLQNQSGNAWTLVAGTYQAEAGTNNLNNCGIYGHDINTPFYVLTVGSHISEKDFGLFRIIIIVQPVVH